MKNKCNWCQGNGTQINFDSKVRETCGTCKGSGIDSDFKDEIVCPYCGEEAFESHEYRDNEIFECGSCEKKSFLTVNYSVDYTTVRIECLNDESKHEWKIITWCEPNVRDGKQYSNCKGCDQRRWIPIETHSVSEG